MEEPDPNFDPNFKLWTAIKEAANLPIVYGSDRKFAAENERMSDIDKLYFEIHASLDADYRVDPIRRMIYRQTGKSGLKKICGALAVTALIRPSNNEGSSREITFQNEDRQVIRILVPTADLSRSSLLILNKLRDCGLHIPANIGDFLAFLRSWRPRLRDIVLVSNGWTIDGPRFFGLRDDRVVAPVTAEPRLFIQYTFKADPDQLARWKEDVAAKFSGNPIALFFLCLGCQPLARPSNGKLGCDTTCRRGSLPFRK